MPRYSFSVSQGGPPQHTSDDCPDDDAAKREASGMFADMARGISKRLQLHPDWQIDVADDAGESIFKIKVAAEHRNRSAAHSPAHWRRQG
jgi:hypothetical protein